MTLTSGQAAALSAAATLDPGPSFGRWRAILDSAGAVVGAALGLVPHVLHHVGLLAGAALVTGASGNALLFAIGLVFSIPLLQRLYRRFLSWWAPTIAVAVFSGLFTLSALVVGPAIAGESSSGDQPPAPTQTRAQDHGNHHTG